MSSFKNLKKIVNKAELPDNIKEELYAKLMLTLMWLHLNELQVLDAV